MCNQAIMLITDEVPFLYEDLFQEYNWRDLPRMPVRLFSYLIGREVPDVERIKWVACANQGNENKIAPFLTTSADFCNFTLISVEFTRSSTTNIKNYINILLKGFSKT
jgi:hypothetical protein